MKLPKPLLHALDTHGEIPFAEFMQYALYAPDEGYYCTSRNQLGKHGDFITAPEITPLFGKTIAVQCEAVLKQLTSPIMLEFGAGNGTLCIDILSALETQHCLPEAYWILDVSGHLQARQKANIEKRIPHLAARVKWLTQWPDTPFEGIIIANEVLDAMPVHRFLHQETGLFDSMITRNEHNELIEQFKPSTHAQLIDYVKQKIPQHPLPYCSEVNFFLESWLTECANSLSKGLMLIIDYGFPRHEYYHPDRALGTLMCHWQQTAHTNPLIHVGEQDITAHVDFTHVAECAAAAGFQIAGFVNQASFLLSLGLLNFLSAIQHDDTIQETTQAVKQLIQPHEMGELFKVMGLTKSLDIPLQGFLMYDKRRSL